MGSGTAIVKESYERFTTGIAKVFDASPEMREVAEKVWEKLQRKQTLKTFTLPAGNLSMCQNLFLSCVQGHGQRRWLDVRLLQSRLGGDYDLWLQALQEVGGFALRDDVCERDELIQQLSFQYSWIDWNEFAQDIKKGANLDCLRDACEVAKYLSSCREDVAPAELGARLFRDSKRLKNSTLLKWVCRILRQKHGIADPSLTGMALLNRFGLVDNPTASALLVYGPFRYQQEEKERQWIETLWRDGQSAMLSGDNLRNLQHVNVELPVLTIENETVFNLMKQRTTEFALVYTAGFPGRSVRRWIAALSPSVPLFHWGDGDPEGYEIAAILHEIHPLKLYRCKAADLEACRAQAQELPEAKLKRAKKLATEATFPYHEEISWILRNRLWLEQESFFAIPSNNS